MNSATILICGDHAPRTQMLEHTLRRIGYYISPLDGIQLPLAVAQQQHPDLVLVDDLTICRQLRQHWQALPIVFYSSDDDPHHVVQALDQGADVYIVVPFAREEFAARIRARLRRATDSLHRSGEGAVEAHPKMLQSADGAIRLNAATYRVHIHGHDIHLTKTEFHLLHCFLLHAGELLTCAFLLRTVWGPEYEGADQYVRVYLRRRRAENRARCEAPHLSSDPVQPGVYL